MDFSRPTPPRALTENIVPMINVVFLLLIFFLMSAQIAPPPPVDVTLPSSGSEQIAEGETDLYLDAEGVAHYGGLSGSLALSALAGSGQTRISLRADSALPATDLARLLPQLGQWGVTQIDLITVARR